MAATAVVSRGDVKVVMIDTQYVKTDPHSFKSVVQRLTGKDCCVSWIEESSFATRKMGTDNVVGKVAAEDSYGTADVGSGYRGAGGGVGHVSMLTRGVSFKDLDRLILKAPTLDEWSWLWAEY